MKKIYCVKLMNTHTDTNIQEREYFMLRFKDEEQDLMTLIKQALTGFSVYQSIESSNRTNRPALVAPTQYFASQQSVTLTGRTVAFEIPQADMLGVNVCFTKALEETGLFSMVAVVDENCLIDLMGTKACIHPDRLAEGNDQFMYIDPNPDLRDQLVPEQQPHIVYPGYQNPLTGMHPTMGKAPMFFSDQPVGYPYPVDSLNQPAMAPYPSPAAEAMSSAPDYTPISDDRQISLPEFVERFSDDLHEELVKHGVSKVRATNQVSRLSTELPLIKRLADKLILESGLTVTIDVDGERTQVPYAGVDFNQC